MRLIYMLLFAVVSSLLLLFCLDSNAFVFCVVLIDWVVWLESRYHFCCRQFTSHLNRLLSLLHSMGTIFFVRCFNVSFFVHRVKQSQINYPFIYRRCGFYSWLIFIRHSGLWAQWVVCGTNLIQIRKNTWKLYTERTLIYLHIVHWLRYDLL